MSPHDGDEKQQEEFTTPDESTDVDTDASAQRVEEYTRLHEHIERLRAEKPVDAGGVVSQEELSALQMVALFRAAAPGVAEPTPEFARALRDRLATAIEQRSAAPRKVFRLSRRGLITAGLSVAAAATGIAVGAAVEHSANPTPTDQVALVPDGTGTWVPIADAAAVSVNAVLRFTQNGIAGFLHHTPDGYVALSAICTHMGCLLNWNSGTRTFDCPCHGGVFTENGVTAPNSPWQYSPLPRLNVRVTGGQVEVYLPDPAKAKASSTAAKSYSHGSKHWK